MKNFVYHFLVFGIINIFLMMKLGSLLLKLKSPKWMQLLMGYISLSIVYLIWNKTVGLQSNFLISGIYLSCFIIFSAKSFKGINQNRRKLLPKGLLLILSLILLGLFQPNPSYKSGDISYTYWHSANGDIFDNLCGGQALLHNITEKPSKTTDIGNSESRVNSIDLLPYIGLKGDSLCSKDRNSYLQAKESLQYTNIAMFAQMLNLPVSMYIFLFQALINLFLFFSSVVFFASHLLRIPRRFSLFVAVISTFCHFFFITFINGHVGSMMIAAPLVFMITLLAERKIPRSQAPILALLLLFLSLTYPYLLPFVTFFAAFSTPLLKVRRFSKLQTYIQILMIIFFTASCWVAFSDHRDKVKWADRSWGTILNPLGPLQYLGVLPGNINGSGLSGYAQQQLIALKVSSYLQFSLISTSLLIIILGLALFGAYNLQSKYVQQLLFCAIFFPVVIAITSNDSYYTYKISYIFQFALIGCLLLGVRETVKYARPIRNLFDGFLSVLAIMILSSVLLLNLTWNLLTVYKVFSDAEQWKLIAKSLSELPVSSLENSIMQSNSNQVDNIGSYIIQNLRAQAPASLVKPLSVLTIKSSGARYSASINDLPKDSFWINSPGISAVESNSKGNFRWVYELRTKPKSITNSYYNVKVLRLNSSGMAASESLCLSLPEWESRESAQIEILDEQSRILKNIEVTKDISCALLQIPANLSVLTLRTNFEGKQASLFDTRRFMFQIWEPGPKKSGIFLTLN